MAWKDDFDKFGVCPFCRAHLTRLDYTQRGWEGGCFYRCGEMRSRWSESEEFHLSCPECNEELDLSTDEAEDFLKGMDYRVAAGHITEDDLNLEQSAAQLMGGAGL